MNIELDPEMIAALKEPLPTEAVAPHPTKSYLSTIKAIYVVERLNDVFGIGGWHVKNEVIEAGEKMIVVKSTFSSDEYGICIEAYGGNDNADRGDAYKGACTDALTKIGSYLYIGMDVFKGKASGSAQKPALPPKSAQKPIDPQAPLPSQQKPDKGGRGKHIYEIRQFAKKFDWDAELLDGKARQRFKFKGSIIDLNDEQLEVWHAELQCSAKQLEPQNA